MPGKKTVYGSNRSRRSGGAVGRGMGRRQLEQLDREGATGARPKPRPTSKRYAGAAKGKGFPSGSKPKTRGS